MPLTEGSRPVEYQPEELKAFSGRKPKVYKVPDSQLYELGFPSGGRLPRGLMTKYTSVTGAVRAFTAHKQRKLPVIKTWAQLKADGNTFLQCCKKMRTQIRRYGPSVDK